MTDPQRNTGTGRLLSIASRVVPGIGRVHAQKEPFAAQWEAANTLALQAEGPLWVALGDSMTQGVGAATPAGGWVGQLDHRLTAAGRPMRVVNFSATGARVRDVLDEQLPRLRAIGVTPDLVTLLIGANDMLFRSRRLPAVATFGAVLDQLPPGVSVVGTLPPRSRESREINAKIEAARSAGQIRSAEMRAAFTSIRGALAEDFFHPNEVGYGRIADVFGRAIGLGGQGGHTI